MLRANARSFEQVFENANVMPASIITRVPKLIRKKSVIKCLSRRERRCLNYPFAASFSGHFSCWMYMRVSNRKDPPVATRDRTEDI